MKSTMSLSYTELLTFTTYFDRLNYLRCRQEPWAETFGANRPFNQSFYKSTEWKRVRNYVIARDNGCDLGIRELPIRGKIIVHHLTPITMDDIYVGSDILLDPENLICCSHDTHNAIHYIEPKEREEYHERSPNDMCPWK